MADRLYTKDILRLAADIPRLERLEHPDFTVTKVSAICGSQVQVDARIDGETVADFGQTVRACALGQASAAIMGAVVVGQPLSVFPDLLRTMRAFLKGEADAPTGPWKEARIFAPATAHRSRHASILLPYEAMADIALQAAQIQAAQ